MRVRAVSTEPEDVRKMEASVRAIEVHLFDLYTLYPNFFAQLEYAYDAQTDRNGRYNHTSGETSLKRRRTNKPRRFVNDRARDLEVQSDSENCIHVGITLGSAIVGSWGMTTCLSKKNCIGNVYF